MDINILDTLVKNVDHFLQIEIQWFTDMRATVGHMGRDFLK